MDRDEARRIVEYLNAAFPSSASQGDSIVVYTTEIALLHRHDIAFAAARRWVEEQKHFPTIAEFRKVYRSVAEQFRMAEAKRELNPPIESAIPEWVHVWYWARRMREPREMRSFPQQVDPACHGEPPFMSDDEYAALLVEWKAAESPRISGVSALLRQAAEQSRMERQAAKADSSV